MEFNPKYVHCVWDDELCGKQVLLEDHISHLMQAVENNDAPVTVSRRECGDGDFPFVDPFGTVRRFCYYDPHYQDCEALTMRAAAWVSEYSRWAAEKHIYLRPEQLAEAAYIAGYKEATGGKQ